MFDDANVYKMPEINYTPLDTSFFEEKPKKKFNLKLILLPVLFLAATPLIFFAYQNSRASEPAEDLDALVQDVKKPVNTKAPELPTKRPISSAEAAVLSATPKVATGEAPKSNLLAYYDVTSAVDPTTAQVITVDKPRGDTISKTITQLKLKQSLLDGYAIVFATDSAKLNQTFGIVKEGRKIPVEKLETGVRVTVDPINKIVILSNQAQGDELEALVSHAVGEVIASNLSADQLKSYMEARNIPVSIRNEWYAFVKDASSESKLNTAWTRSPYADFGEVFKVVYGNKKPTPNWAINTVYGDITATQRIWVYNNVGPFIQK